MSVASLELCRELYELSGWGKNIQADKLDIWGVNSETGDAQVITQGSMLGIPTELYPAYSLGFLLRRLPRRILDEWPYHLVIEIDPLDGSWVAQYLDGDYNLPDSSMAMLISKMADTPEDAACRLAIELYKQNILTKENN